MSDEETIAVAETSAGPGGEAGSPGESVDLPVVEILTGRGFITGKSGSGKSNTASVVIENLLENNFPVLIVDTDGEYYGLKEAFEILHVGADEECDIQVSPEHSEKIASLALEQNVPIILDVSGYLDEGDAEEMLLQTARSLFAKEKKLKKPFLMLVEECHEYIPEKGGMGEAGKMLIKIAKRGRKHGLGVVGISQRPADVKKDYITQCDWLCWHRLTWNNDTKVVGRILGSEYADAIEDMGDGEAFLITDWSETIRRVQFHRKETFDAGATPGLDDFERPELKSVSGDLVEELSEISDEQARRESEIADLRQELDRKQAKIDQLERELEEARDLKRMADRFSQALLGRAEAPHRKSSGSAGPADSAGSAGSGSNDQRALDEYDPERQQERERDRREAGASDGDGDPGAITGGSGPDSGSADASDGDGVVHDRTGRASFNAGPAAAAGADGGSGDDEGGVGSGVEDADTDRGADGVSDAVGDADSDTASDAGSADDGGPPGDATGSTEPADAGGSAGSGSVDDADLAFSASDAMRFATERVELGTREAMVEELASRVDSLPELSRAMLRHYREVGVDGPVDAHVAAGGDGDRTHVYSRNRAIRRAGLIRHAGRGQYAYALPDLVREAYGDHLDETELAETVRAVEATFVEGVGDDGEPDDGEEGGAGVGSDAGGDTLGRAEPGDGGAGTDAGDADTDDPREWVADRSTGPTP